MDILMQCKAKSKQSGQQCKRHAVPGREVCPMHGGKTPRGFALPQTKTGRWSQDLPTRLSSLYSHIETDDSLLSLRDDIRLIDAMIRDKFSKLDTNESSKSWDLMRKAVDDLETGMDKEDYAGCRKALRAMRDVVDMRVAHYAAENEVRNGLEQRRKMIETEQKITLAGEQAISVERAMLLVGAIAGILKTRIHDTDTFTAIQQDISRLLDA
jgi:hypothetical protein